MQRPQRMIEELRGAQDGKGSTGAMTTQGAIADVGLIGLAVMGQNLALNMADHGYRVAVYNRTTATMERFVAHNPGTPGGLVGCSTLQRLVTTLKKPRKIVILVKAGPAVDSMVEQLMQDRKSTRLNSSHVKISYA